ncbi:MAG TPA: hypothetical protein C5S50_10820 [Methanosarcinaceae archaeon]|nr:hypothetical protein [Methanosarcinaceae archaeon]
MKNIDDNSAISEVMALLMLVLVAVSASAAYYTWIADLQEDVQATGTDVAETRMNNFMSEIEVICYPEYTYYNTDSNLDGEITINATLDERFIQEIEVLVINKALFNLTNVKVKAVSFGNGGFDWAALHLRRSNLSNHDRKLMDREEDNDNCPRLNGDMIYFTSENKTNTSMKFITDEGYPYFALNGTTASGIAVNTTNITDLTQLHNPTYEIGDIPEGEHGTGYIYLLINNTALPLDTALKIYVTNDHGIDAYRTIQFSIQ